MNGWSIDRAHILDCAPPWRHDLTFADWDLWTVLGGACVHHRPDGDHRLEAGDCLLLPPGVRQRIDLVPGASLRLCAIHFLGPLAEDQPLLRRLPDLPFALGLMRRIVRRPAAGVPFLLALLAERERQTETPPDAWWQRLEELCTAILERPQDDYALSRLARRLHASPAHLSRRFRAHAGTPLSDYVIAARLDRARRLLAESDLPVKAVAGQCGYASVHFFSRQFHQRAGVGPAAWRAARRGAC